MADGLSVRGLVIRRGRRRVVDDVSFAAPAAGVTALVGPNGAGKTTALKAIAGLLPYAGDVTIAGQEARTLDRQARARVLAYVPQHSALDAPMPVREVIAQGRFAHQETTFGSTAADTAAVADAAERTDTQALLHRTFDQLSYGERRRVLLARALATGAQVLLLDEPTAALDVGHALTLLHGLRALARAGSTVLLVLHQLQEVADIADHVALLNNGRLHAQGPATHVLCPATVREIYGVEMVPAAHFGFRLPGSPL